MNKKEVPIWEKSNLTLEEAAAYSGIGINKLRELSNRDDCEFVLWVGSKRLIKRRLLDQFLERCFLYNRCRKKVAKEGPFTSIATPGPWLVPWAQLMNEASSLRD